MNAIWTKRNTLGQATLTAQPTDVVVCSVAPGEPSYFWPAINNSDPSKTPTWYASKEGAKKMEGTAYQLTHTFNRELAIQVAIVLGVLLCLINHKK